MTLEHVDTIIAFAAVMAGVSLFITTLTQMVSAALGLRGHNLRWGLQSLLEQLDPALSPHAEALSKAVLTHPLISDSIFTHDKFALAAKFKAWFFSLPIVGRWRYAAALRLEELQNILKRLADEVPSDAAWRTALKTAAETQGTAKELTPAVAAALAPLLKQIPAGSPLASRATSSLESLRLLAGRVRLAETLERIAVDAAAKRAVLASEVQKLVGSPPGKDAVEVLQNFFPTVAARAARELGEIDQWFDSAMDRVSQHFTLHMRLWTVAFSMLVAAAMQLDTLQLLKRLASDADLRSRVVASAESLNRKADDILIVAGTTNPPARACVEAMSQLKRAYPDTNALGLLDEPAGFTNIAGAEDWFRAQIARHHPAAATNAAQVDAWLAKFRDGLPQAELRTAADQLQSLVKEGWSLQLMPDPYPASLAEFGRSFGLHWKGILASAALLSLGAPFWFNLLKSLSNLRPILAQKQEQEAKAAAQG